MNKECSRCRETKELSEFGKNRSQPDGLHYYCRACISRRHKQRSEENKKRLAALDTSSMSKQCYECKQHLPMTSFTVRNYSKDGRYYKCRECAKTSPEENRRRNDRNYVHLFTQDFLNRTPLQEHEAFGGLTKQQMIEQLNFICRLAKLLCRRDGPRSWHLDHIIPVKDGGIHHPDNIRLISEEEHLKLAGSYLSDEDDMTDEEIEAADEEAREWARQVDTDQ